MKTTCPPAISINETSVMPMHGSFLFSGVSNTKFCVNILATIVDLVIFATESNLKMSVEQMFIVVQLGQSIYCKPNRAVAKKKLLVRQFPWLNSPRCLGCL